MGVANLPPTTILLTFLGRKKKKKPVYSGIYYMAVL
jgi:hypothetical protein